MISLQDSWQAARQQRQLEADQRRQMVHQSLATIQADLQQQTTQLRADLSLFRDQLAQDSRVRRAELQDFCFRLQTDTQTFLVSERHRRQLHARQLSQDLEQYVTSLRQQTADFLSVTALERSDMADLLAQELQSFHHALEQQGLALRRQMQAELAALKLDTQQLLDANYQRRVQRQAQTAQELTIYMAALRTDVQRYLSDLEMLRQQRAAQMQQDLAHSRMERQANAEALFGRLAQFRSDLQTFHRNLKHSVWGQAEAMPSAHPHLTATMAVPVAKGFKAENTASAKKVTVPIAEATAPPAKVEKEVVPYEKEVYTFLNQANGARLTQIEAALGINRFQAVDALRALIKKGLITQRDRVYHLQTQLAYT